jgi:hypothetical protein
MAPALMFAIQALTLLPGLIQAGVEVVTLIQTTTTALNAMQAEGRDPTDAEWAALRAAGEAALARLDSASA